MAIIQELRPVPQSVTLSELSPLLRRRLRTILVLFSTTVLGAYLTLQFLTERYETSASILVKIGRENSETPVTVQNGGLLATGVPKEEIASELELLTSRSLVEGAVDRIGPQAFAEEPPRPQTLLQWPRYCARAGYRWVKEQAQNALIALNLKKQLTHREAAIVMVKNSLDAEVAKDSNVIDVHLKLANPQLAERVLGVLLESYLTQHTAVYKSPNVKDFFTEQLAQLRLRLADLQAQREAVRRAWGLSSVPDQQAVLVKQENEINSQISMDQGESAGLARETAMMQSRLPGIPDHLEGTTVQSQNPSIGAIRDRIAELRVEHARLISRYLPDSEPVKKNEGEIAELQSSLATQEPTITGSVSSELNPLHQELRQQIELNQSKIAGLEARGQALTIPAKALQAHLQKLNEGAEKLESIEREIKIAADNYETYARHREQARISEELDWQHIANVAVLSPPSTPMEPVYPHKLLIMGLSIPMGLFLGILLALFQEYMDDTIHSPKDIEDLEEPLFLGNLQFEQKAS
jgi:uncharacterized protein involved in exopolysaccharide biosynthesis